MTPQLRRQTDRGHPHWASRGHLVGAGWRISTLEQNLSESQLPACPQPSHLTLD